MASKLGVRYGNCNQQKPFAIPVAGGISAFDMDGFNAGKERYMKALRASCLKAGDEMSPDELELHKKKISQDLEAAASTVMIVSGLLIRWQPLMPVNEGYIVRWGKDNLSTWDASIERRAAPSADDAAYQHFTVTGTSSLLALISQVVFEFKTTGEVSAAMKAAFLNIKLNVCFNATPEDITLVGQCDNIEQGKRKKHTELDNILVVESWVSAMPRWSRDLKTASTLDLCKFAMIIGNPRELDVPSYLKELLRGKPPTMANKVAAVTAGPTNITRKWLSENCVKLPHPQMHNYDALYMRHRFVQGFRPIQELHKMVFSKQGELGFAHKASPLSKAVLMDPQILLKDAFKSTAELDKIPAWKDGTAGVNVQLKMVAVAAERYEHHGFAQLDKQVFTTGMAWIGFARIIDHIHALLCAKFGAQTGWKDSLKMFYRDLWKGEYDAEVGVVAHAIPGNKDDRTMQQMLAEQFKPLVRKLSEIALADSNQQAQPVAAAACNEDPRESQKILEAGLGDVTDQLEEACGKGQLTAQEKALLAAKMSQDEVTKRDEALAGQLHRLAAETFRSRVKIFGSAEACKHFMESSNGRPGGAGIEARAIVVDGTMPQCRQTGPASRKICKAAGKELQRKWAEATPRTKPYH